MDKNTHKEFKEHLLKLRVLKQKITKPFLHIFYIFLIFLFYMMTDRVMVQVNYILNGQNTWNSILILFSIKNIENPTNNTENHVSATDIWNYRVASLLKNII